MELDRMSSESRSDKESKLYPLTDGDPDALVLHCSDPRFQDAFHDFIRLDLKVRKPAVIAIPGSTASFGVQAFMPKGWHALRRNIELMVELGDFPRVILINHDDCRGYASVVKWLGRMVNIDVAQRKHLKVLSEFIRKEYLPKSEIELYQARIVAQEENRGIRFDRVI